MRFSFQTTAGRGEGRTACAILAEGAGLPKLRVKDAMQKGAVWLTRTGSGERRLRRAQTVPRPGDGLAIHYDAELRGRVGPESSAGRIDLPLDGRAATTEYSVARYDPTTDTSLVDVVMRTGRRHQLRRHFAMVGFPVMGDPRYGENNKNTDGLKLTAGGLEFTCPFSGRSMVFQLEPMP